MAIKRTAAAVMLLFAWCAACEQAPTAVPAAEESLRMDTVRAFDLEQRALAQWELELAESLARSGKRDEALQEAEEAQQRYRAVQAAYEKALTAYPDNAKAHNYYGELLLDVFNDEGAAVEHWEKAVKADPSFAPAHVNLGNAYTHHGRIEEGMAAFERGLELDPDNPDTLYYLVQVYLINWPDLEKVLNKTAPVLYEEAMAMSEKAARLAPADYELVRDHAMNYFAGERMNVQVDWKKAAEAWQRARALAPNEPMRFQTWLYEARAHIRGGDTEAAEHALQEALKILPDNQTATELLKKVRAGDQSAP